VIAISDVLTTETIGGLEIVRAGTAPQGRKLNTLIYGPPGVGKTVLAASADEVPAMRKVLFLDIEGGTLSIEHRFPKVEIARIKSWGQIQDVYNDLFNQDGAGYGTAVIDSSTESQKYSMDAVMDTAYRRDQSLDRDIPMQRHWGVSIEHMRRMIRAFRDLPMHTIITALSKEETDNLSRRRIQPSMPGKLASEIAGFMDIVLYMYMKEDEEEPGKINRVIATKAGELYTAKDRSDRLPAYMVNPTMKQIYDLVIASPTAKDNSK